jgi:hypothetical protein
MPVSGFNVNPGGSVPEAIEYLYGAVPPVAASVAEYGVPTLALLAPHVPHCMSTAVTVMLQVLNVKLTAPSRTFPAEARTPMYL